MSLPQSTARAVINLDVPGPAISRHLYGHFAEHLGRCIYGGFWVGEDSTIPNESGIRLDVVEALKALNIPNLRWPGGCFADEYHQARILTAPNLQAHNTPEASAVVAPTGHEGVRAHERGLIVDVPAHSYVTVRLQLA